MSDFSHSTGSMIHRHSSSESRRSSIFSGRILRHQFVSIFVANVSHRLLSFSGRRLYSSDKSSTNGNDGDDETFKMEQYYKHYMDLFKTHSPTNGNTSGRQPSNDNQEFLELSNLPPNQSSSIASVLSMLSNHEVDKAKESPTADSNFVKMLSHVDNRTGKAKMVDVGGKSDTRRVAMATGRVRLTEETFRLVQENQIKKGDVLTIAQLAGIMATKQTSSLIPLCHNITIADTDVQLTLDKSTCSVGVCCTVSAVGKTGVEMEALTGVTIAALTVYDMCKSVSQDILIEDIKLVRKVGGKSGDYVRKS